MSEYLNKKAVLEWFGLMHLEYSHNAAVSEFIESGIEIFESGAFDAEQIEIQRLRAIEQAIRDFQPTTEQQAGYDALVAWLESTTQFVLDSEKEKSNHE